MDLKARSNVKHATLEAVVIRADGTREDLGTVARYDRNPIKRLLWKVRHGRILR